METIPKGAMYIHDDFFYKKGLHGFVFRWNGEEWIKSEKTMADMRRGEEIQSLFRKEQNKEAEQ